MSARHLVELQERIHRQFALIPEASSSFLVFAASGGLWAIEFAAVGSVSTCGHITPLWSRQGLPRSVIGISASSEEILTVIDGGLILGANPTKIGLKSRLVTFTDPALKGIAILVDRALDPMNAAEIAVHGDAIKPVSAEQLSKHINQGVAP